MPAPIVSARRAALVAAAALALVAALPSPGAVDSRYPDVVDVRVRASGADRFDFDVTVSSPYDTPARYADGFRVVAPSGQVLGERKLLHDHRDEQPFTRDLHGVRIDAGICRVTVQARDQTHGYGGRSVEVALPDRAACRRTSQRTP